jgi:polyhydroxybutyrate depolymerase
MASRAALCALLATLCGAGAASAGDQRTIKVDDIERGYWLHVPATARADAPLVIVLHGAGGFGRQAATRYRFDAKADKEGFVVAAPDATPAYGHHPANFATNPRAWNDGLGRGTPAIKASDDIGFVLRLIDSLVAERGVDRSRVYVAGFSSGSGMAQRLASTVPDRLAAVVAVAGSLTLQTRPLTRSIPFIYVTGDSDPLNPIEGGTIASPWGGAKFEKEPIARMMERWRNLNGCPSVAGQKAAGPFEIRIWTGCAEGVEMRYIVVRGLGHHWPGVGKQLPDAFVGPYVDSPSLTDVAWDFFRRWRRE